MRQGGVTAGQTITLQCLTHTQRTKASPTRQKKNFLITTTMDIASKNEFIYWMQRAVEDQTNDCYIELYNILLRAFVSADADFDGQVWTIFSALTLSHDIFTLILRLFRRPNIYRPTPRLFRSNFSSLMPRLFLRIQLKLNTALLSTVRPCVRPSVRHRRDISHFSHI